MIYRDELDHLVKSSPMLEVVQTLTRAQVAQIASRISWGGAIAIVVVVVAAIVIVRLRRARRSQSQSIAKISDD